VAGGLRIAAAKPHLASQIARRILNVEAAGYARPECRNIAIGHALQACRRIAALVRDTRTMYAFARR
jgi:hypothetical protein